MVYGLGFTAPRNQDLHSVWSTSLNWSCLVAPPEKTPSKETPGVLPRKELLGLVESHRLAASFVRHLSFSMILNDFLSEGAKKTNVSGGISRNPDSHLEAQKTSVD